MEKLLGDIIDWILARWETTSTIPINQNGKRPLILTKNEQNKQFKYPDGKNMITLYDGTGVELNCAGRTLLIDGESTYSPCISVTCFQNNCQSDGKKVLLTSFTCSQHPVPVARPTGKNWGNIMEFEIGFECSQNMNKNKKKKKKFLGFIQGHFDKNSINTLYTKINMDARIRWTTTGETRPPWKKGFFTDKKEDMKNNLSCINNLYTLEKQRKTINKLLGLPADSTTCIQYQKGYYLAGGHLTAMADHIYESHQRATFFRLNAAPMWQIINNGNWGTLEHNVRRFVTTNNLYISVYTGTHGVLALKRCANLEFEDQKELYLGEGNKVPVPKFFWKVIYNQKSQKGTAFVVVNDPYLTKDDIEKFPEEYNICSNICSEISWLTWKPENLHQGYAYCCVVEEFRKVVTTLPDFTVVGLLK